MYTIPRDPCVGSEMIRSAQSMGQANKSCSPYTLCSCWRTWSMCPHSDLAWSSQGWSQQVIKVIAHSIIHLGLGRTWKNFIPPDFHIIIPVRPGLLMVESQSMKDLMFNDGLVVTPLANGKVLSHVLVTNLRPAPSKRRGKLSPR